MDFSSLSLSSLGRQVNISESNITKESFKSTELYRIDSLLSSMYHNFKGVASPERFVDLK